MDERDDYAEGDPRRGRSSPLLTLILFAAIVVALILAGYLALIAIVSIFGGFPK